MRLELDLLGQIERVQRVVQTVHPIGIQTRPLDLPRKPGRHTAGDVRHQLQE